MANQIGSMENSGKLMSSNLIILQLVAIVKGREDSPIILHANQLYNSEISNRPLHHWHVPETTANLKKEVEDLMKQRDNLKNLEYAGIPVELHGFNSMNDQKALYSALDIGKMPLKNMANIYFEKGLSSITRLLNKELKL